MCSFKINFEVLGRFNFSTIDPIASVGQILVRLKLKFEVVPKSEFDLSILLVLRKVDLSKDFDTESTYS